MNRSPQLYNNKQFVNLSMGTLGFYGTTSTSEPLMSTNNCN